MTAPQGSRLVRKLGTVDAVLIGLGAMIGAGVFAAFGPASAAAGPWLLVGLVVAGAVAACNAASSAQLAALYPTSGGAYLYGRRRLGPFWGFLAGWAFIAGKLGSCAAMALTFAAYAAPEHARAAAVATVVALTAVNLRGVEKTAALTRVLLAAVLASLAFGVTAAVLGREASPAFALGRPTLHGILQSAGILFFAFAGYARIATLGEEVVDPERTIPRAIPIALAIATALYAVVGVSLLAVLGPWGLAESEAPLAEAVEAGRFAGTAWLVRAGAAVACLSVLLSLIAGLSRTVFAMAGEGDLSPWLAAVHGERKVPHRAEALVGALVCLGLLRADILSAISFSSFGVLTYYAVANAAAVTLGPAERRWPAFVPWAGLAGCLLLALSLPPGAVLRGGTVLAVGAAAYGLRRAFS